MGDLEKAELCDLLEALKLGQERALEIMAATGKEVFGHSFLDDGNVNWQFSILKVFGDSAIIQLYSWLTGSETELKKVNLSWLKEKCALYLSEKEWVAAGDKMGSASVLRHKKRL